MEVINALDWESKPPEVPLEYEIFIPIADLISVNIDHKGLSLKYLSTREGQ
jgi:hypothetical protein